jgi:hypothetical protein
MNYVAFIMEPWYLSVAFVALVSPLEFVKVRKVTLAAFLFYTALKAAKTYRSTK